MWGRLLHNTIRRALNNNNNNNADNYYFQISETNVLDVHDSYDIILRREIGAISEMENNLLA